MGINIDNYIVCISESTELLTEFRPLIKKASYQRGASFEISRGGILGRSDFLPYCGSCLCRSSL